MLPDPLVHRLPISARFDQFHEQALGGGKGAIDFHLVGNWTVAHDQIAGVRVIVEAGFRDFKVSPSQGTHFFQSLTSFNVGYFTVNPEVGEGWVDWDWLSQQPAVEEASGVRHLHLPQPILIQMNGRSNEGLILKPDTT